MSRDNRIIYEGAIYHIYQRGNNKEYIFKNDMIKSFMLRYLKEYNKKFDYEILAYAIMNNHYHILLKTNKSTIDKIMFYFNNLLGKYINNKLGRSGHAFEGRYKCKLVATDSYLIWLLRYIHRNPVKAHICSNPNDYRWSSHFFYKNYIKSFINIEFILKMLGNDKESAVKEYLKLVNSVGDDNDKDKDYEAIKKIFNFEEPTALTGSGEGDNFILKNRKTLDEIVRELNVSEEVMTHIRGGSRKQILTSIKLEIIKYALTECYSLKEIALYLNAAPSTVSKLLTRNKIV